MKHPKTFHIAGNLTHKPSLERGSGGRVFARLQLLTNRYSYFEGQWIKTTYSHSVLVWGEQAKTCEKYLEAGAPLAVDAFHASSDDPSLVVAEDVHFLGLRTMLPTAPKNSKDD